MKNIINSHRFFIENSPEFVGRLNGIDINGFPIYKMSLKNKLYYPIAYIRFMYSVILNK